MWTSIKHEKSIELTAHFGVLVRVIGAISLTIAQPPLRDTPARLTPKLSICAVFIWKDTRRKRCAFYYSPHQLFKMAYKVANKDNEHPSHWLLASVPVLQPIIKQGRPWITKDVNNNQIDVRPKWQSPCTTPRHLPHVASFHKIRRLH